MTDEIISVDGGWLIKADAAVQQTVWDVLDLVGQNRWMIYTDPPYGSIVKEGWDVKLQGEEHGEWMLNWTNMWAHHLNEGAAFYVWGGVGKHLNRSFFYYAAKVEHRTQLKIQNVITWKKRRGIGTAYNYLFTREELLFMLKEGKNVQPLVFNVPLLDELRGYAGYNNKYPAKSPYKRRSNVWTDVTEILRGKKHPAQKPVRLAEIAIETSSHRKDVVVDLFAGSGSTGVAAHRLGRDFVLVENDDATFEELKRTFSCKA